MSRDAIDSALAKAGSLTTYVGAGTAGVGWITINELAALIGALAAVVGLAVQVYFTRQRNRREVALHRAQMRQYQRDEHEDAGG